MVPLLLIVAPTLLMASLPGSGLSFGGSWWKSDIGDESGYLKSDFRTVIHPYYTSNYITKEINDIFAILGGI